MGEMPEGSRLSRRTKLATPHSEGADRMEAESSHPIGTAVKHGRIRQSLAYWCLNAPPWHWDIERICATAVGLGCPSVELVPPELWPTLQKHGLTCALLTTACPTPFSERASITCNITKKSSLGPRTPSTRRPTSAFPTSLHLPAISGAMQKIPRAVRYRLQTASLTPSRLYRN